MKDAWLLPPAAVAVFLASWALSTGPTDLTATDRSAGEADRPGRTVAVTPGMARPDLGEGHASPLTASAVPVPPALLGKIRVLVMDPLEGGFSDGLLEILELNREEKRAAARVFEAFLDELRADEKARARPIGDEGDLVMDPLAVRVATLQVEPADDSLDEALLRLQTRSEEALGSLRGRLLAALARRQFVHESYGPEIIGFRAYPDGTFRLELRNTPLAGTYITEPTFTAPDLRLVPRYRHLADLPEP